VAGVCPQGGWPVVVAEEPDSPDDTRAQTVRLTCGAMATSATTTRRWRRASRELHHIVDPRTGAPSTGPWRAVTVAAPNCATANAASTALIVGGDGAEGWLRDTRLPARLVRRDGSVHLVGAWPRADGAALDIPLVDHLGTGIGLRGGSS
jgi:FAD:protein FMN transferase